MNILVIGCNGFVGEFLIQELLLENTSIFGIDIHSRTTSPKVKYESIDLTDFDKLKRFIEKWQIKEIYNLAAVAHPKRVHDNPKQSIAANVMGAVNLYEIARNTTDLRILQIGSSEEYKTKTGNYICYSEEEELEAHNIYGATKISAEILGQQYVKQYNTPIIFVRSFNHSGPGQQLGYVIPDIAKQFADIHMGLKEPVLDVGNVNVGRDFLDVRDVVKAYIGLMKKGISGEIYNICSGNVYYIKDLINTCTTYCRIKEIEINQVASKLRLYDPALVFGNNSKVIRHTGWQPKMKISDTIKDVFHYWIKKNKEIEPVRK